jgi:LacI family transcriptional regulator
MTELLGRGKNFTAVACYNDSMAAGAMGVLNDNGIDVPGEISLIGFDDVLVSLRAPASDHGALSDRDDGNPGCRTGARAGGEAPVPEITHVLTQLWCVAIPFRR